jgi:hypothetical protein
MNVELRWRIFIAVLASYSDGSKRMPLPKAQSAPPILYAGIVRNRAMQEDGAEGLFDHVRESVREPELWR